MSVVTYIEFFFPGSFFAESTNVKFNGDPIPVPEHAFGWRVKRRSEQLFGGETLVGPFKFGPRNLIGNFFTLEELLINYGDSADHRILISNVMNNDYKGVCLCRTGNWQPVDDDTNVVASADEVMP